MENVKGATPVSSPKDDAEVGNGMSKREARRIRMRSMNKSEIAYMRRKRVFEAVWPFFRFFILFGLEVNLINSKLCMYLPAAMGNGIRAGLMIFIFRQFFKGLPKELEDAAYLDGCGPLRTFVQVMIPNTSSSFLTVFLFSVVWYWNDYYVSSTFFTKNQTIALMLKNLSTLLSQQLFNNADVSPREQIVWMEAGCLISILPILIMYVFLQKYFTEGIERSGLVG